MRRATTIIPPTVLVLAGLLPLAGAAAARQQSAPIPILQGTAEGRLSPSDRLQRHVDAGADGWVSEAVVQELDAVLGRLAGRLQDAAAGAWTEGLAAETFSGSAFDRYAPVDVRVGPIEVRRFDPPEWAIAVGAAGLEMTLKRWLDDFRSIRDVRFKQLSISLPSDGAETAAGRLRFHLTGSDADGATLELHGYWRLDWKREAGAWRWTGLDAEPYWRVRTARPLFQDVTGFALAGQDEALRQFRQGIDWYTATLDRALGVDIYGHNGVAIADIDGDGWEDFYVCQPAGLPNRLFRNLGNGRFEDVSRRSGTDLLDLSSSALFFDHDNDGDADLLVVGRSLLLLNNDGSGAFSLVPASQSGFAASSQDETILTTAAVADYDGDGDLDVFAASYAWKAGEPGYRYPTPYHDATNGSPNILFRNDGGGRFSDVTAASGMNHNNDRFSLAAGWADYDADGDPDLYVANDFGRNNLYRNDAGRFEDVATAAGVEDLGAGMSVAWADYDNDGWLDLYVGNMFSSAGQRVATQEDFRPGQAQGLRESFVRHAKGNTLFRNRADGTFEDVTAQADVALGLWAWSSQFIDIDSDGWQDIVIANGYITNENSKDL